MNLALPAASTTEPVRCPHFGPCGGCTSLDVPYGEELRAKAEKLRTAFSRHPELERAPILAPLGADEPLLYRTSIKVPFGWSARGPVAGFYERRSHRIVDLETCLIQDPRLTALLLAAKEIVAGLRIAIHDARTGRGILRHFVARAAEGTGELLAGLVVQAQGYGKVRGMALQLMERFAEAGLVGVVQNVQAEEEGAILGERTLPLAGRPWLDEQSDGLAMRTTLASFVQVNGAQAQVLYREVLRLLDAGAHPQDLPDLSGQRIVDLFCGIGPIALRAARAGAEVEGVEHSEDAVRCARHAARANGLDARVRFRVADAAQALERLATAGPPDAVVVDPPRRGLAPRLVQALLASGAPRVVYVSCDPFTFARDLAALRAGYEVVAVRPIDLFPRTLHLEAVALLQRA